MRRTFCRAATYAPKIHLFDVSLRDGIQSAKNAEKYTTEYKKRILDTIVRDKRPQAIEIGSFVNPKVLPIMKDTEKLLEYGLNQAKLTGVFQNFYVLVPNAKQMTRAILSPVIHRNMNKFHASINFSFITSVSESFQKKNTNSSLEQTKHELSVMTRWLNHYYPMAMTKLYVSCVNECPIEGKMDTAHIVREIKEYHWLGDFDEICLSDTTGNLEANNLDELLGKMECASNIPVSKLSLHLHGTPEETRLRDVVEVGLRRGIRQFDVSTIEEGGCSVTMGKERTNPNLTYETVVNGM